MNSKLKSKSNIATIVSDNNICDTDLKKADIFNSQFSSVFVEDNGTLPRFDTDVVESIPDIVVSIDAIVESINRLKVNSAAGPDSLPSILFKKFPHEFAIPLQKIFQSSYNLGVLPSQWKVAHVVPIFKNKGKRSDPLNYRPVSLTCICCKLFERIIKDKMWKFARENKLISEHQHGFVSKRSTQTQLLECGNYWTYWVSKKEGVDVVYLDISKAFDTVSHPKLLYKL